MSKKSVKSVENILSEKGVEFDLTFSFSAGGWFQMYHFGAAQAIVESGIIEKMSREGRHVRFCGSSAGSLVAVCLASKSYRFKEIRDFALARGEHYRSSLFNLFCMRRYLSEALDLFGGHMRNLEMKPHLQAMLNDGSLEIFVTTLPHMKRKVVDSFLSYDDIAEALKASCCMAPLVGVPFRMRATEEWVCDGAVATIQPHKDEPRTISVSPFYFSTATIHPTVLVPVWWGLRPPEAVAHRNLFALGYNDMIEGLVANGYILPQDGEPLLMPEVHFSFERSFLLRFFDYVLDVMVIIFVRPFVVVFIYVELAIMSFVYFMKGMVKLDCGSLGKFYDNLRNMVSLRTLGRLVFGEKVPHNGQRLERSSRLYRVFNPILLGGRRSTDRAVMSPTGAVIGGLPSLSPTTLNRARTASKSATRRS
ncbi:patatin-like phospholipase [Trypanosoma grayi]|uniref:patatin-like phospholipase n=1 Tax=Trypanosoma grayi TaxID=71804 RepID=UPI0004F4B551|nr:patatin-like phospholipase [Trypanosoma grayi]KEG14144.1 patatin-like phospholipase [Trypanosoma grayi]